MDVAQDKDKDALEMVLLKESDFDNALQNGGESTAASKVDNNKDHDNQPLASKDYQLHEALNLLKGLSIVSYQK